MRVIDERLKWSSAYLDNLSNCLLQTPEKFRWLRRDLNPWRRRCNVQPTELWSHNLFMCSRERNYEGKKCLFACMFKNTPFHKLFTRTDDSNRLTCSQLVRGFIAQLVEHCTGIKRSWVRIPLKPPEFCRCLVSISASITSMFRVHKSISTNVGRRNRKSRDYLWWVIKWLSAVSAEAT